MTHSGGQPHLTGYRGQRYKVDVLDEVSGERVTVCWSETPATQDMLKSLNKRHGWSGAQCVAVTNRETGE